MMAIHLQREIEKIKKQLLHLSALVEEDFNKGVRAFETGDTKLTGEVVAGDEEIDRLEVELEENCLKILALHQPVAIDLRFIIAVLKINPSLERIGDFAVKIARAAEFTQKYGRDKNFSDFVQMAEMTQRSLKRSLDALVNLDAALAEEVRREDAEIDRMKFRLNDRIREEMKLDPAQIDFYVKLLGVSRYFERAADHASSIAEDVIYLVSGEIVRHQDEAPGEG
ncbi:MAG: phosphate signaling complex protein PhoU [bacterium]|jgi:phosphate transport system protein